MVLLFYYLKYYILPCTQIKAHFFFSWKRSGEAFNEEVLLADMSDPLRSEVIYNYIIINITARPQDVLLADIILIRL